MISEEFMKKLLQFRQDRDWEQFHTPKDLAISITLEAAELLETFQWSGSSTDLPEKREEMAEEIADIMMYCLYLVHDLGLDLDTILNEKLRKNEKKYPVELVKGSSKKYTEYKKES